MEALCDWSGATIPGASLCLRRLLQHKKARAAMSVMAKAADPTAMPAIAPVPKPPSPSLAEELDTALVADSEASLGVVLEVVSAVELEAAPSGSKKDFRRPSLFVKTAATS